MRTYLGKVRQRADGLSEIRFKDQNLVLCSLRVTSVVTHDLSDRGKCSVLIGPLSEHPKKVRRSPQSGPDTVPGNIPPPTQAHLSRIQVAGLIKYLTRWLETGYFE